MSCVISRIDTRERHRDHHTLSHPAGELVRVVVDAARRVGDADLRQQFRGTTACLSPRQSLVRAKLLGDLPPDGVHRRQRRHRILEDHRDLAAAHTAHLTLRQQHQVLATEEHFPFDHGVRVADQAHHRHHRNGLARAGLADDAHHLADCDRQ
jgi:hypothetical protein